MKTSIDAINDFITNTGNDWKQYLDNYFKEDSENPEDINHYIEIFISACREDIMSNNQSNLKTIEKKIDNDLLYKRLQNYLKDSLSTYFAAAPLRTLDITDSGRATEAVKNIFFRAILRFDRDIINEYEKWGFSDLDAMLNFFNMLDGLCAYLIEMNCSRSTIEKFVYNNMRLSKNLSAELATLIDDNFHDLKINYIIDKLKRFDAVES